MTAYLPCSVEIMAALIGCGAFVVFHANAGFFWLLNRLHEVPVDLLYRTYTLQSLVMGLSGPAGVLLLWTLGWFSRSNEINNCRLWIIPDDQINPAEVL